VEDGGEESDVYEVEDDDDPEEVLHIPGDEDDEDVGEVAAQQGGLTALLLGDTNGNAEEEDDGEYDEVETPTTNSKKRPLEEGEDNESSKKIKA